MDPQKPQPTPSLSPTPPRPVAVPPRTPAADRVAPLRPTPPNNLAAPQPRPTLPVSQPVAQQPLQNSTTQPVSSPQSSFGTTPTSTTPPSVNAPAQPPEPIMAQATTNDHRRLITKKLRGFASFAIFVSTVIVAAMLINTFIFQSYYVDGTSMTPTLQNEDRLIIEKTSKTFAALQGKAYIPARGEIVVLDSALLDQYGHNEQLIKRVVGLPGDTIIIQDGVVTIKNQDSPEGFDVTQKLGLSLEQTYSETPIQVTVPENSIYVLGDNRGINGSLDSRSFGTVPVDKIQGRLALRIFPFNRTQVFN